ncbi:MAG: di-heme oxidoredictase family protein [Ginsengibacter sp.]
MKIQKSFIVTAFLLLPVTLMMCRKPGTFNEDEIDPRLSGGAATVFDETSRAFTHNINGLDSRDLHVHGLGDSRFEGSFVTPPALINPGLGPVFNNVSCISCHHNDGKGTPTFGSVNSSMLMRLSLKDIEDAHGGPVAVPGFGLQLQDVSTFGIPAEAKVSIAYTESAYTFADGETVHLRMPAYTIQNAYASLPADYLFSPRMAPSVFGIGLLANIPESTILSFADENDKDHDGISGKPNYVWNPHTGTMQLGRFGLKANTSEIKVQVASAYQQDMGVTNSIFPNESSYGQIQSDGLDDDPELPDSILNAVAFYVRTLAVPARRNVADAGVKQGEKIFTQINCTGCHKPTIYTGVDVTAPTLSNQRIHPYTDLLLHDMGDGLADNRPDFAATGSEWRTPPLWGVGLLQRTNGIPYYLHDGRARTFEEAILWHGGEAAQAKQKFTELSTADRKSLMQFLKSL